MPIKAETFLNACAGNIDDALNPCPMRRLKYIKSPCDVHIPKLISIFALAELMEAMPRRDMYDSIHALHCFRQNAALGNRAFDVLACIFGLGWAQVQIDRTIAPPQQIQSQETA